VTPPGRDAGPARSPAGLALLAVAVIGGLLIPAVARAAQPVALHTVRDPQGRFTIDMPDAWQVATSYHEPAVSAKSPAPPGELADSVEVIARDLPLAISPDNCARQVAQLMRLLIHQWETLSEGAVTFGGLPAYSRTYTWRTKTGQDRRSVQTCAMMGRRAFVLIGTTMNTPDRVNEDLPEILRIMNTFRPATSPAPEPTQDAPGHQR
jgi:hypothetical protein